MAPTKPQRICRLCSKIGVSYRSLFADSNKIADKISKCLPILVNPNDDLPGHICPLCLRSLNTSYKLLIQAIKVDSQLRQRLADTRAEQSQQQARENVARNSRQPDASNPGICGICEIRFDDATAFDSHMEMFHQSKWVCNLCQSTFPTSEELLQHKHKSHYDTQNNRGQPENCMDPVTIDIKEEKLSDSDVSDCEGAEEAESTRRITRRQTSRQSSKKSASPSKRTRSTIAQQKEKSTEDDLILLADVVPEDPEASEASEASDSDPLPPDADHLEEPESPEDPVGPEKREAPEKAEVPKSESPKKRGKPLILQRPRKVEKPEMHEGPENAEGPENTKGPAKTERLEKIEGFGKTEGPEMPGVPERSRRPERSRKPDKIVKPEIPDIPEIIEVPDGPGRPVRKTRGVKRKFPEDFEPEKPNRKRDMKQKFDDVKCVHCDLEIDSPPTLIEHMKIHEPYEVSCLDCGDKFHTAYALCVHRRDAHRSDRGKVIKFFCRRCNRMMWNMRALTIHERSKRPRPTCKYCQADFCVKRLLRLHLNKEHRKEMMNDETVTKWTCDYCKKEFVDKKIFYDHVYLHSRSLVFRYNCKYCDKDFGSASSMKNHVEAAHDRVLKYECEICKKKFYNKKNLQTHEKIHMKLHCKRCRKKFDNTELLQEHMKDVHNVPVKIKPIFTCPHCDRKFNRRATMEDHKNTHSGRTPQTCPICNKKFRTYAARWAHVQRHTNSAGFTCDFCQRKFINKRHLQTHIYGHLPPEEWRYTCEVCGARFPQMFRLTNHKRKHTGERKYLCDICGSKFGQKGHLDKHIRSIHFSENPHGSVADKQENEEETDEEIEENGEENYDTSGENADETFGENSEEIDPSKDESYGENTEETFEENEDEISDMDDGEIFRLIVK